MKQSHIPCYYYPTEIILVDDNPVFLKNLDFSLGSQFKCQSFNSPEQAIQYATQRVSQFGSAISRLLEAESSEGLESYGDDEKKRQIANIHQEIHNPNRFKEISVIVVDYAMPTMDGLEFCKQIRVLNNPIKLLMLTGEADYPLAVQAFNDGLIDKFIMKSKENYTDEVTEALLILQEKYFFDLSASIRRLLQPEAGELLNDREFLDIFNKTIDKIDFKEFYVLEDSLSFLFMNEKANLTFLIVKTDADVQTQYELAVDDVGVSSEITHALQERKKIAYFPDSESILQNAESWILHDCKPIGKKRNCYFAILKDSYNFNKRKIFSYDQFLEK